jgi:hypothetical protein
MLRLALPLSLLAAVAVVALVYMFSKQTVVDEMIEAAHRTDVAAVSARIDWEGLRKSVKTALAKQKKMIGGDQMGPPPGEIPKIVDYYLQPENLDILFYYREELFPAVPAREFIHSVSFSPPYGFTVTLGFPKSLATADMPATVRDRTKAWITFRLDGLTWKARELSVPLFMVPRQVYSAPATQIFGRPPKR